MERKFTIGLDSDIKLSNISPDFNIVNDNLDNLINLYKDDTIDVICSTQDTRDVYIKAVKNFGIEWAKPFIISKYKQKSGKEVILGDIGANPTLTFNDFIDLLESIEISYNLSNDFKFGIVNIGEESYKGDYLRKKLYQFFSTGEYYNTHFIGNIEGDGLFTTDADIVLVDGFTGNVLLKALEYAGLFDYKSIGGARLVNIRGNVYIGHGKSDEETVTNMCYTAYNELKT